jgi:D-alanyl-D-alanine carboxypeptidase (penicillin-binding protein 5/6)
MSRELLKHDAIRRYTTIWMDTVRGGAFGLSNTNKLVRFYEGTTGLKTGYTSRAGHCLSASAKRDGLELIAVVLGGDSSSHRFSDAKALLNWGFANYALVDPTEGFAPEAVSVRLGTAETVVPVPEEAGPILVEKAKAAAVKRELELAEEAEAPVEAGQVLGWLRVRAGDEILAELPLTAAEAVPRLSFAQVWLRVLLSLVS